MNEEFHTVAIAKRIKELRTQRQLTMEKLGESARCSKAYISQIEKGQVQPSISVLSRIAQALGAPVSDFLRPTQNNEGQRTRKLSKSECRTISYPDGKVVSRLLTRGIFGKRMQPLISTIQPGGRSEALLHPAGSEEFVLVLNGEVCFHIEDEDIDLTEGDTLYFEGDLPHHWENRSENTAEVLFIWTPPVW